MIKQKLPQASHKACVPGLTDNPSGGKCWAVVANSSTSLHQGQRQSTSTTARQNAPPEQPRQPGAGAKRWRFVACLRLCSLAQEELSFRRPPTSRLASQNHESGSPVVTGQFGVHSFLSSSGEHQSSPIDIDAARLGCAISFQRQVGLHGMKEARRRRPPDDDRPRALKAPSEGPAP